MDAKLRNFGLLLLRFGLGLLFVGHGIPKLLGGPLLWSQLGRAMGGLGITFWPSLWGLLSGMVECFGGLCFALGLAFRPVCLLLAFNMLVASLAMMDRGFTALAYPLEDLVVFLSFALIGPGAWVLRLKKEPPRPPQEGAEG